MFEGTYACKYNNNLSFRIVPDGAQSSRLERYTLIMSISGVEQRLSFNQYDLAYFQSALKACQEGDSDNYQGRDLLDSCIMNSFGGSEVHDFRAGFLKATGCTEENIAKLSADVSLTKPGIAATLWCGKAYDINSLMWLEGTFSDVAASIPEGVAAALAAGSAYGARLMEKVIGASCAVSPSSLAPAQHASCVGAFSDLKLGSPSPADQTTPTAAALGIPVTPGPR